jgi:tRNA-2-methylthio-N6-dimethylallyladenosine synthase
MSNNDKQKLTVDIKTYGCQMNVYDSEAAEGILKHAGYEIVREGAPDTPDVTPVKAGIQNSGSPIKTFGGNKKEKSSVNADVILMNTCSVREHAEDRVYGRLGMLGKAKKKNPDLIVGLMGCMVEEHKEKLFKRFPQLDLMVGTRNIKDLPDLIEEVRKTRRQVSNIKQDGISIEYSDLINRHDKFHAWLPIMTGCNKVCTFCIVPVTRGSEVSMPSREVYREASRLANEGVKWITLLGQNVNSYDGNSKSGILNSKQIRNPNASNLEHPNLNIVSDFDIRDSDFLHTDRVTFPELLDMLCQIEGLERISFTTSHPQDATEELFRVIARNPKISRRFHLPLQSGANHILRRMKRLHTYEDYRAKIEAMRKMIPDIAVTTDIIVGFSGETDEDYRATIQALQEIRYDGAFIYKYSVRPGTPAAKLQDDVPLPVKEKRNQELLAIQREISDENNRKWLGKAVSTFVEDVNPRNPAQVVGRTDQDKKVIFEGSQSQVGQFVKVTLVDLHHETFIGTSL